MSYPRVIKKASTGLLTIPIGGGSVTASLTTTDLGLSSLELILNVRVIRHDPVVNDVYEPSYGFNASGDAVGITVAAGTGTTLEAEALVLGSP